MNIYKKYIPGWKGLIQVCFSLFFIMIQSGSLMAQDQVKEEELPKVVVKAIQRDFSCQEGIKWFAYDKSANLDYYVVRSSGENVSCEATYDNKGQLINAKTIMNNVQLPDAVQKAINNEYAGWTVASTQAVVQDFRENSKYYKVGLAEKGHIKLSIIIRKQKK